MAEEPMGWFHDDVVSAYLSEDNNKEYYSSDDVPYFRTEPANLHPITVCDNNNVCYSPQSIGQCLCLDVGCWTGNGPKSTTNHQMHREFGVVCGSIAALCSYRINPEANYLRKNMLEKKFGKKYTDKIEPFLEFLSSDPTLGKCVVLNALEICDAAIADNPKIDTETLHVFLGDLHLPTITDAPSNKSGGRSDVNWGDVFERGGRLQLDPEVMKLFNDMVIVIEYLIKLATNTLKDVALSGFLPHINIAKEVVTAKDDFLSGVTQLERMFERLADMERIQAPFPQAEDPMSEEEIDNWFEFYYGNAGKKGADIFQSAGNDLVIFLDLLQSYQKKNPGSNMNFVQLGDCCDFWIGMKCGVKNTTSSNPDKSGVELEDGGHDFARYWYEKTKQSTASGEVLKKLESMANNPAPTMKVTLLYGNHDNYLKHTHGRKEQYLPDGSIVCAEHGHQSDSFNCDMDPVAGWALTQVAFAIPAIRDLEDPLATALTLGKRLLGNDPGARLQRIARAADVCLEKKRLIYVMAHTHQPLLKRITIRQGIDPMKSKEHGLYLAWEKAEMALARLDSLLDVMLGDGKSTGTAPVLLDKAGQTVNSANSIVNTLSKGSTTQVAELLSDAEKYITLVEATSEKLSKKRKEALEEKFEEIKKKSTFLKMRTDAYQKKSENVAERVGDLKALINSYSDVERIKSICQTITDPDLARIVGKELQSTIVGVRDFGYRMKVRDALWDSLLGYKDGPIY